MTTGSSPRPRRLWPSPPGGKPGPRRELEPTPPMPPPSRTKRPRLTSWQHAFATPDSPTPAGARAPLPPGRGRHPAESDRVDVSCGLGFRLGAPFPATHAGAMPSQLRPRDRVVDNHLPLARALAWRYRGRGEPLDDLVQVASLALVKAADRWEPERGLAFSTYAVPTILGELRRYFRAHTWDVRPPRRLQELTRVVARAREELVGAPLDTRAREALRLRFEDDLHQHEIAARLGVSQVSVSRL